MIKTADVTLEKDELEELLTSDLSPKEIQKEILDRAVDKISKKQGIPLKANIDECGSIHIKIAD